jgi:hypothetical protein
VPELGREKIASPLGSATDSGFRNEIVLAFGPKMDTYDIGVTTSYRTEPKKCLAEIAQVPLEQNRLNEMPDLEWAHDERILRKVA